MNPQDLLYLAVFLLVFHTLSAFPAGDTEPELTNYAHSIEPRPSHKLTTDPPLRPIYLLPDDFFPENDRDVVITWATRRNNWNKETLNGKGGLYKNLMLLRGFHIAETPYLDSAPLEEVKIPYRK